MPAIRIYQFDSYAKEFDAVVTRVEKREVYLDRTAFHPRPVGGLDADHGWLIAGERKLRVVDVVEKEGDVAHIVEEPPEGLREGDVIHGVLDWERRYRMMRLHTALHIIAGILYKRYEALVTGSSVSPARAHADFDLSKAEDWRRALLEAVEEANSVARKCIEVKVYWLPREEALRIPGVVKLAEKMPQGEKLRIVEIPGVDVQADEGPHVRNTCEIGEIIVEKLESRGRRRRRLYFNVQP